MNGRRPPRDAAHRLRRRFFRRPLGRRRPRRATLRASGGPAVLMFETLAERTLALAQLKRRSRPGQRLGTLAGTLPRARAARLRRGRHSHRRQLRRCQPRRRRRRIQALAAQLGLPPLKVAVVEGDDLLRCLPPAWSSCCRHAARQGAGQRQRLPRCAGDRAGAARGRRGRRHRPRGGSGAGARADAGPLRLGAGTTGTGWPAAPWPATCWNAARRSPAATSRIPA